MKMNVSLGKIVRNDGVASGAAMFFVINWGMYFILPLIQNEGSSPLVLPVAVSILSPCIVAFRFYRATNLFRKGVKTTGCLEQIRIFRGRGRFEYSYQVEGRTIQTGIPVLETKQVRSFSQGDSLFIYFDPHKPKRSIVADLYTNE